MKSITEVHDRKWHVVQAKKKAESTSRTTAGDAESSLDARVLSLYEKPDADVVTEACAFLEGLSRPDFQIHLQEALLFLALQADHVVVAAALLCPMRKDGSVSQQEILDRFGAECADLVEKAYAPCMLRTDTEQHQREDVGSLLRTFSDDVRTTVLRMGLRLAELERIEAGDEHCRRVARETLDLYVPLAGRLGMRMLRQRLEDQSFRLLEPEAYERVARDVMPLNQEDRSCLGLLREGVQRLLRQNGINCRVESRVKGLYSIYRKMSARDLDVHSVMDKLGLRVIVPSVQDCYLTLGKLHTHFRPIPGMFSDYVGLPKVNGYQSLHTCVYPVREISIKPVEFQIRTDLMHMEAEYGVAAHWKYKEQDDAQKENERQLRWLRSLPGQHDVSHSHADFIERLSRQVFEDHLIVFSNRGQKFCLSSGSTLRDLLVLNGAGNFVRSDLKLRVNGELCALDYQLQDGDSVDLGLGLDPIEKNDRTTAPA